MYYRHEILGEKRSREMSDRIAHPLCKERRLYRLDTRNLGPVAVFNGHTGFIGLRRKFNSLRIDTEYHWDPGADGTGTFGTANPWRELDEELPADIPLREFLPDICRDCGVECEWREAVFKEKQGEWPWFHLAETVCQKVRPVAVQNQRLFEWLKLMEEKYLGPPGWAPEWLEKK